MIERSSGVFQRSHVNPGAVMTRGGDAGDGSRGEELLLLTVVLLVVVMVTAAVKKSCCGDSDDRVDIRRVLLRGRG